VAYGSSLLATTIEVKAKGAIGMSNPVHRLGKARPSGSETAPSRAPEWLPRTAAHCAARMHPIP
jgi:hypothetical protein